MAKSTPTSKGVGLSAAQETKIIELHKQKLNQTMISDKTGVPQTQVRSVIRRWKAKQP